MQGRRPDEPLGTGASRGRLQQTKNVKYGDRSPPPGAVIERFNYLVPMRYTAHAQRKRRLPSEKKDEMNFKR